jgi:AraC family transcriptional regulator
MRSVALTVVRKYSIEPVPRDQYKGGLSKVRLRRVLDYIDSYLAQSLAIEELAQVAGLSKYHFGKMFKQSTNVTIHQYVLSRRIGQAQKLLSDPRYSLAYVALAAGFPNQSHFTTVFTSRMGITPAAYRSLAMRFAARKCGDNE